MPVPEGVTYSRGERLLLGFVATIGLLVVNVGFGYGMMAAPGAMREALTNPISLAFIIEAFLLMGVLAWLLGKWGVARLSWGWFVGLSLLGSMAFALPVVLLWGRNGNCGESSRVDNAPA